VSNHKFLIMILALMMLVAGCSTKKVQDTKEPQPLVGIVDMKKAVQSHPKYKQVLALEEEVRSISAQAQAQQAAMAQSAQKTLNLSETSQGDLAELNKTFQQEFTEKMSLKEKEVNTRIAAKENSIHQTLSDEFKVYTDEIDKEYQPQIFNLQLKLKTVQLAKEEAASLQGQLETLQTQRAEKIAEKQKQLNGQMTEKMAPDKAAAQQELEAYSKQVNQEISQKAAAKQEEIAARNMQTLSLPGNTAQESGNGQQQAMMKQQELKALQDSIIQDINDKTGKVAIESGLEAVLTNVTVNVSGVDITAAVIAECNK
jgi:Skp family chaperone for outer membrane proteins